MSSSGSDDRIKVINPYEGTITLVDEIYCDKCEGVIDPALIPDDYVLALKFDPDNPDLCLDCLHKEMRKIMMES